jgi:peptidoglycan/xylan/chitin deacetylase (PgdA/CDA1 family)
MGSRVTLVAYHYVRDLTRSRYPRIKGLTVDEFRGQLEFMTRYYRFVGAAELLAAIGGEPLPPAAAILTFDDGLIDHYTTVFPVLEERRISGLFFPLARPLREGRLEDVHRLHFILASMKDPDLLVKHILQAVARYRDEYSLDEPEHYWERLGTSGRYDPPEVAFVKRMLQAELPEDLRGVLCAELFGRTVSCDEAAFAGELYASMDQLRVMSRCGMYIGAHGYGHYWLDRLSPERQCEEISNAVRFLDEVGTPVTRWIMCYPYGRHNESLRALLRRAGCAAGLTTRPEIARPQEDDPLALPRLDTNDVPKSHAAQPTRWVEQR